MSKARLTPVGADAETTSKLELVVISKEAPALRSGSKPEVTLELEFMSKFGVALELASYPDGVEALML